MGSRHLRVAAPLALSRLARRSPLSRGAFDMPYLRENSQRSIKNKMSLEQRYQCCAEFKHALLASALSPKHFQKSIEPNGHGQPRLREGSPLTLVFWGGLKKNKIIWRFVFCIFGFEINGGTEEMHCGARSGSSHHSSPSVLPNVATLMR